MSKFFLLLIDWRAKSQILIRKTNDYLLSIGGVFNIITFLVFQKSSLRYPRPTGWFDYISLVSLVNSYIHLLKFKMI